MMGNALFHHVLHSLFIFTKPDLLYFPAAVDIPATGSAWACVRLVIIMGILWLMEVATWSFASHCSIP